MTERGKAVLFTLTADGSVHADVYLEGDSADDPELCAQRMRSAVGDDMPDAIFSIGMNDRARFLMTQRRMQDMGFQDYDEKSYEGHQRRKVGF